MKLVNGLIPFLIVFGIGLFLGQRFLNSSPRPAPEGSPNLSLDKFRSLTENEIAEYYQLKTMEERYKKADEILAKIMTIFVADLGIRMSASAKTGANMKIEMPTTPTCPVCPAPVATSSASTFENRKKQAIPAPVPARVPVTAKELEQLAGYQKIKEFLEMNKVDNLSEALAGTSAFSNKSGLIDMIQGDYRGPAEVSLSGKRHLWQVVVRLGGVEIKDGQLNGESQITIAENGQVFSKSSGSGILKEWRESDNGSPELFLRASPSTYFQLYFLPASHQFVGNVYSSSEGATFVYIGTIRLR